MGKCGTVDNSWMNAHYPRTCWMDKKHYTSSKDRVGGPGTQRVQ